MTYWSEVSELMAKSEDTNLRNEKTKLLAEFYVQTTPKEARLLCYLLVGRLVPSYEPVEFAMAEKMLLRAIAMVSGKNAQEVLLEYKEMGDLGEVVGRRDSESVKRQIGKSEISITEMHEKLYSIARLSGMGSQEKKVQDLAKILESVSASEAKYVMRLVSGKLRLGFSAMTILDALSWAKVGDKSERVILEHAYNVSGDMGMVAELYLSGKDLSKHRVVPGVPVVPMKAERLGTVAEIWEKLGECCVEPKLDGMRVQIHAFRSCKSVKSIKYKVESSLSGQSGLFGEEKEDLVQVRIFSRGLEDITRMFPELVSSAKQTWKRVGDFVLDGEAIGVSDNGSFVSFQETMKRKRKHGIGESQDKIPVVAIMFDVLYGLGEDVMGQSYLERRAVLEQILEGFEDGDLRLAKSSLVKSAKEIEVLFDEAIHEKEEGILVKKLLSPYRAGARDMAWVKYKRAHEAELVDTVDAVVMGAYVGKGKRQKFGIGALLVGVRNGEKIVTLAKIGTGITDSMFGEIYEKLKVLQVESLSSSLSEYEVPKQLVPDIWVEPKLVVEVEADEVTESPLHSSGYALRFPRLIKIREDKTALEITTQTEIIAMREMMRK